MRFPRASVLASASVLALALLMPALQYAQDADRKVSGGIAVSGWQGKVDPAAANQGMSVNDTSLSKQGDAFHIATGPATVFWNPANTAKGDYSVSATFREPKQTANHAHPFGIFIGGSKLDTDQPNLLYCVAYRDGTYLVRGFSGGNVFTPGRRSPNPAVHKAAGPDAEVTQEVGWNVKGDQVQCMINGTAVATFSKADIVGPGKLDSTDGVVGFRFTHNTDAVVTNFKVSK